MITTALALVALAAAATAIWMTWSLRRKLRGFRGSSMPRTGSGFDGSSSMSGSTDVPVRPWNTPQAVDGTRVSWDAHNRLIQDVQKLRDDLMERLNLQEALIEKLRQGGASSPSAMRVSGSQYGAGSRRVGPDELGIYEDSQVSLDSPSSSVPSPEPGRVVYEPALLPTPSNGRPVELRDGAVVISRSLASVAVLVEEGGGQARLYVNDQVEIDHMALERWSTFFDFGGGQPYRRYRTERPATVAWDPVAGRGDLREPGRARSLST